MNFRVFDTKTNKEIKGALVDGEGNVCEVGLLGGVRKLKPKRFRVDLLVGFDENKNPIYENDPLEIVGLEREAYVFIDAGDAKIKIGSSITPFGYYANRVRKKERT